MMNEYIKEIFQNVKTLTNQTLNYMIRPFNQSLQNKKLEVSESLQYLVTKNQWSYSELVKLAVELIPDINKRFLTGDNFLDYAAIVGDTEMIDILYSHGANITQLNNHNLSPLLLSVICNNTDSTAMLIKYGADVNQDSYDFSPLYMSVMNDNIESTRLILESGANPDIQEIDGRTSLYIANDINIVRLLLNAGANPNIVNNDFKTPLHISSALDNLEKTKLLLLAGANPNAQEDDGWTPLSYAVSQKQEDHTKTLLAGGARIDNTTKSFYIESAEINEMLSKCEIRSQECIEIVCPDNSDMSICSGIINYYTPAEL